MGLVKLDSRGLGQAESGRRWEIAIEPVEQSREQSVNAEPDETSWYGGDDGWGVKALYLLSVVCIMLVLYVWG